MRRAPCSTGRVSSTHTNGRLPALGRGADDAQRGAVTARWRATPRCSASARGRRRSTSSAPHRPSARFAASPRRRCGCASAERGIGAARFPAPRARGRRRPRGSPPSAAPAASCRAAARTARGVGLGPRRQRDAERAGRTERGRAPDREVGIASRTSSTVAHSRNRSLPGQRALVDQPDPTPPPLDGRRDRVRAHLSTGSGRACTGPRPGCRGTSAWSSVSAVSFTPSLSRCSRATSSSRCLGSVYTLRS